MLFSPQIPLPLEPGQPRGFDDFVAGPNSACLQALRAMLDEPGASLYLHGPPSSGKSHLLNAACLEARRSGLTAFYLALGKLPPEASASLDGLEAMDLVCLDDLHEVAGDSTWEEALFHFINRLRGAGRGRLLVASRERLGALPLGLPDLRSRLAWGLRLELQTLDESGKREVMRRRAEALSIDLPAEVVDYLLRHGRRGMGELLFAVEQLRLAAITEKRRITVPLARRVLAAEEADSKGSGDEVSGDAAE